MMKPIDLNVTLSDLESGNIEKQMAALEQARDIVKILVEKSVGALENSSDRVFVAERLSSFGSIAIPPLEAVLANSDNSEVKTHASLVLLQLGSKSGVAHLMHEMAQVSDYACLIARHMVRAEIVESREAIVAYLRASNLEKAGSIICLLRLINREKIELPEDIRERLINANIAAQIQSFLTK